MVRLLGETTVSWTKQHLRWASRLGGVFTRTQYVGSPLTKVQSLIRVRRVGEPLLFGQSKGYRGASAIGNKAFLPFPKQGPVTTGGNALST